MKKIYLLLMSATLISLVACGGKEEKKENSEETEDSKKSDEPIAEEITYEAFDSAKLEGNWKVIDAQAYSKDKMIGQIYSFIGDTATYYAGFGEREMIKGVITIEGELLSLKFSEKAEHGNVTMTSEFKGGFFEGGKKLQMNAKDAIITLERQ